MTLHPMPYTKVSGKRKSTSSGGIAFLGVIIQKRELALHTVYQVSGKRKSTSSGGITFLGTIIQSVTLHPMPQRETL